MNNKEITRLIEDAKQTLNENIGSDMEDYLDGRLSAFEDIQELLETETKVGKKGEEER
ncbi:MAG: hypothetical protein U9N61_00105 [Euryarchaeota archaeon]|nr:hypothetical protein [Euryarchaeota archaeon]